MKIAVIGAGNMGSAIARGLAKGGLITERDITVSNPSRGKLDRLKDLYPGMRVTSDNAEAAEEADLVFLAVKPRMVESVLTELRLRHEQVLASLAVGVTFDDLERYVADPGMTMFRIVPNTAISERQSLTLIAGHNTNRRQEQLMLECFNQMGLAILLPEEQLAAGIALASCGIAYVLKYIQAGMQAGVEMGIGAPEAIRMVAQTAKGAAELLLRNHTHPAEEIDKVCTPGGLTIKGINELEQRGFTAAVIAAMKKSL